MVRTINIIPIMKENYEYKIKDFIDQRIDKSLLSKELNRKIDLIQKLSKDFTEEDEMAVIADVRIYEQNFDDLMKAMPEASLLKREYLFELNKNSEIESIENQKKLLDKSKDSNTLLREKLLNKKEVLLSELKKEGIAPIPTKELFLGFELNKWPNYFEARGLKFTKLENPFIHKWSVVA